MNDVWRDFYAWLDNARNGAIFAARDRAREQLRKVRDRDLRQAVQRMLRLMDEELMTRADLARHRSQAGAVHAG